MGTEDVHRLFDASTDDSATGRDTEVSISPRGDRGSTSSEADVSQDLGLDTLGQLDDSGESSDGEGGRLDADVTRRDTARRVHFADQVQYMDAVPAVPDLNRTTRAGRRVVPNPRYRDYVA